MIWPETELDGPDPMLDELRAIRDEISATVSRLPEQEQVEWYHEQARKAAEQAGCILIAHPTIPNAMMVTRPPN